MKLLLFLVLTACSPMVYTHGVPNLVQVGPGVWRSGQITTREGWSYIRDVTKARRVHVIKLNFDNEGSDALAVEMGFDVHVLAIQPQGDQDLWDSVRGVFVLPDMARVAQAVQLLAGADSGDVWLVHCTHGQDRTGLIVGIYRVMHDHWTKVKAYQEMRDHHFHPALHGVHEAWERFDGKLP